MKLRGSHLAGLLVALLAVGPPVGAQGPYETPPFELVASEILAPDLVEGEHHTVAEKVTNDGYMNSYVIDTEFGQFTAEGTSHLRTRIGEISAIAQLVEVSRTDAFADAVAKSATRQYRAAKQVIDEPVDTAKGIPGGVSRFVKRTHRQVKDLAEEADESYDEYKEDRAEKKAKKAEEEAAREAGELPPEEKKSTTEQAEEFWEEDGKDAAEKGGDMAVAYGKKWSGYTGSRRQWAQELGVDPYTDNEVLNKELNRVSEAAAVGKLGMKLVPIPKVSALGYLGDANELVWKMDPLDLRMRNEKVLYEMGISEAMVEALYENKHQTPSTITVMTNALAALDGVEGRQAWIERAAAADSKIEATYMMRAVNFLAAYHQKKRPIARVVGGEHYPQGLSADGRLVFVAPMDYVHWTEELATLVARKLPEMEKETGAARNEAWIEGTVSEAARAGLEQHGFEVHPGAFAGLEVTFGEGS